MRILRQNGRFWDIEDGENTRKISDASMSVLELRGLIDNVAQKEYFIGEAIRESAEYASFAEGMADFTDSAFFSVVGGVCYAGKNRDIDELTVPHGVHTIKNNGFRGFTALKNVYLPPSVKVIESAAFSGCVALDTAELPPELEELGANAFTGTQVFEFKIPMSLRRVTGNPFPKGATVRVPQGLYRDAYYAICSLSGIRLSVER